MAQTIEEEARALRRRSTRRRRTWLAAIAGNVLVFAVLVVGPYVRALHRAKVGREAFARFATCLVGGEREEDPGVSLPEGSRERYADRFREEPGWPQGCSAALAQVAPDEAFWIFPDIRNAERETRRAVAFVQEALAETPVQPAARTALVVPERPWQAMQRLMAALSLWAEVTDGARHKFEPAIRFPSLHSPRPERVPAASRSGDIALRSERGARLELMVADDRGISWVRVADGGADTRRLRRPRLVRQLAVHPTPHLYWATPEARCGPSRCIRRAMGVASFVPDEGLPTPTYVRAHPAGSLADVARWDGRYLNVLARGEGGVQWRRFDTDAPTEAEEQQATGGDPAGDGEAQDEPGATAALRPVAQGPMRDWHDVAWVGDGGEGGLWAGLTADGALATNTDEVVAAGPFAWMRATAAGVFAGDTSQVVWFPVHEGHLGAPVVSAGGLVLGGNSFEGGGVRVTSQGPHAALVGVAEQGRLRVVVCEGGRCTSEVLARLEDVLDWAPVFFRSQLFVAATHALRSGMENDEDEESGEVVRGQITLTHVAEGTTVAPAPCFDGEIGFCGAAVVAADEERLVVAAWEETDLLFVESRDGVQWQPLHGLRDGGEASSE